MIQRKILGEINKWIGEPKILILKGPRQVGKTTLMRQIQKDLEERSCATLYFSADMELGNDIFRSPKNFLAFIKTQLTDEKLYLFIDEFQYIQEAGLFLKGVFDELKDRIQLIVSGSSSLEITRNSEFLTGRKVDFEIGGISFFEYINYFSKYAYKQYRLEDIYDIGFDTDDIKRHLLDYVRYGSYPEVITTQDLPKKQTILKEIVSTYISKDISGFMKIDDVGGFNNLLRILSNQVGNLVNRSELANSLNVDGRRLQHYLDILVGTYVIDLVSPYYTNVRKEISKMPKVYFRNTGVINYFSGRNIVNMDTLDGSFVENIAYSMLSDIVPDKNDILYHRTISKSEIDFVVRQGNSFIPIEVKYRNKSGNMPVAINNFEANYANISKKILITKDELSFEQNNYKLPFYLLPFVNAL